MWRWVIGLGAPELSKDCNSFIFKGLVVMDCLTLQDKGTRSSVTPRPTHPKTQNRVPRTPNSKLHCCMSRHAEDEALRASHCNNMDQHISCTDRQTFWITNLADKTDKALRPCVQFRQNISISYSAYCTECFSKGRQQERRTVFCGDEKETSNTAKSRQNPS